MANKKQADAEQVDKKGENASGTEDATTEVKGEEAKTVTATEKETDVVKVADVSESSGAEPKETEEDKGKGEEKVDIGLDSVETDADKEEVKTERVEKNEEKTTPDVDATQKKKRWWSRLRRKKTASTEKGPKEPAVLDDEEVVERLYQQLAKTRRSEYVIIKFRKRNLLLITGLVLIGFWVWVIASNAGYVGLQPDIESVPASTEAVTPTPAVEVEVKRIRIRNLTDNEEAAVNLAQFLQDNGYQQVEVLEDTETEFEGVAVVVKPENMEVRTELEALIQSQYELASPSAELTQDSDFDAVILFSP